MFLIATLPTDLQILGSELHNNAFGGRAPPGPAVGAIAVLRPSSHYKREGRGRKGLGIGSEGVWRDGKGMGRMVANQKEGSTWIFVEGPLVTPLTTVQL